MNFVALKYVILNNKLKSAVLILTLLCSPVVVFYILSQGGSMREILATGFTLIYVSYLLVSIHDMLGTPDGNDDVNTWLDKNGIQHDIDNIISNYKIAFPAENTLVPNWNQEVDREEILNSGNEIMVLKSTASREWNLGIAALQYSIDCVLPDVESYIHYDVKTGILNFVSHDILEKNDEEDAKDCLYEYLDHEFKRMATHKYERFRSAFFATGSIRAKGFFGPVLLNEYEEIKKPGPPNEVFKDEAAEFLFTLEDIAIRDEPGELANPGRYFDIKTGIIGGYESPDYYTSKAKTAIQEHKISYSIAEGEKIEIAKEMAPRFTKENMGEGIRKSEAKQLPLDEDIEYDNLYRIRLEKEEGY
jgi:hypothetical protein